MKLKEETVRNYAILILLIISTYFGEFKITFYCLLAGLLLSLIYDFIWVLLMRK